MFTKSFRFYPVFLVFSLLLMVQGCCPHRFLPKKYPDPLPAFCVPGRIRVALVLGSGGVRGAAHVGVLEVLEEANIPIDLIVGCSAGSIVGALYADNPSVHAIKEGVWSIRTHSVLDIELMQCRYGLSQSRHLYRVLNKHLNADTFEDLKIPLVVVASDLHTGELVPMGSGDLVKAVQASCSIPFVFVPCEHLGRVLVDGGVVNPVPARVARDLGAEIIIAVDLCELLDETFPTNLFSIASRSAEIAFMWQNEACSRGADVVIRPKTCGIGTFDDKKKDVLYEAGKRAAREHLPYIKELIANLPKKERRDWRLVRLDCYTPKIYHDSDEG